MAGLQVLSSLWDQGRRSTPNWDMLVSWQREKKDGRTRPCLLKLLLGNGIGHFVHISLAKLSPTAKPDMGGGGQPSKGWESIILP